MGSRSPSSWPATGAAPAQTEHDCGGAKKQLWVPACTIIIDDPRDPSEGAHQGAEIPRRRASFPGRPRRGDRRLQRHPGDRSQRLRGAERPWPCLSGEGRNPICALADDNKAIAINPKFAFAYFNRGIVEEAKRDLAKARHDYDEAIRLKPEFPGFYKKRALLRLRQGDVEGAVADASIAIGITDSDPDLFIARANAYRRLGALDKARADYEGAMRLEPNAPAPYVGRGNVRAHARRLRSAHRRLSTPRSNSTRRTPPPISIAPPRNPRKATTPARPRPSDAVVRQWPDDENAYANRGFARFAAGDFAGAAADLERAAKDSPTNAYVPLWRYLAQARAGARTIRRSSRATSNVDRSAWPAPVFALFLGREKPDAVRVAAAGGDAAGAAERDCEATFYLGEFALLAGRRDDALVLLRRAGERCPTGFTERAAARGELARLSK